MKLPKNRLTLTLKCFLGLVLCAGMATNLLAQTTYITSPSIDSYTDCNGGDVTCNTGANIYTQNFFRLKVQSIVGNQIRIRGYQTTSTADCSLRAAFTIGGFVNLRSTVCMSGSFNLNGAPITFLAGSPFFETVLTMDNAFTSGTMQIYCMMETTDRSHYYAGAITVTATPCRTVDSLALVNFYNATGGANWRIRTNWLTSNPISTWYGVTTNAQGCVQKLSLFYNQLSGNMPNLELSNLQELTLKFNQLTGNIPNFNLPSLQSLNLSHNQLTGTIPLFNLPNLQMLDLAVNQLSGTIPSYIGTFTSLGFLNLQQNQFNGEIPDNIRNLTNLIYLFLGGNQLSGNIPTFINNLRRLSNLDLSNNRLNGEIPNFTLPSLVALGLNNNQFTGRIPNFTLPNLTNLLLNNNQFSGRVPSFTLPNLQYLHLHKNCLSDSFPVLNTPRLIQVKIDSNKFTFTNLIPNFTNLTYTKTYAGQDSIFTDTTYHKNIGDPLTIDLGIDSAVASNQYDWYRNTVLYQTGRGNNKLIFNNLAPSNEGVYKCVVTNPNAPNLTLYSKKAIVALSCRIRDSLALVELYNSRNGVTDLGWVLTQPMTTWRDVRLNEQGCVDSLWINPVNNGVVHGIPFPNNPATLGKLLDLTYLQFGNSKIPVSLGNLVKLRSLSVIGGIDTIPSSLGNLNNLESLSFFVGLTGSLPPSLGNLIKLKSFTLTFTSVTGIIPETFGRWVNLKYLSCNANRLSGNLPDSIGNLRQLETMWLRDNGLTGIPESIGNLTNLKFLSIPNNQLSGNLPISLGNLLNLTHLQLSHNNLSGSIPSSFGNLRNLESLYLDYNRLSGNLPDSLGRLNKLVSLVLCNNYLSGNIPSSFGNLTKLTSLVLSHNNLSGSIPASLGTLSHLELIRMQYNQLTGVIPATLGNLDLADILMNNNQLTGCFPTELRRFCNLSYHSDTASGFDLGRLTLGGYNFTGNPNLIWGGDFQRFCSSPSQSPIANMTASATRLCSTDTIKLTANTSEQNLQFQWSKDGVVLPTETADTLRIAQSGIYSVKIARIDGCDTTISQTFNVQTSCNCSDSLALLDLYKATGGANWRVNTNWLSSNPIGSWHGVTTDNQGCVSEIRFYDNMMNGYIPSSIGNLSNLQSLMFYINPNLTGSLPSSLGNLANLRYLILGHNSFTDSIPSSLGNLVNLTWFDLSSNRLSGNIPVSLGRLVRVTAFQLQSNRITGTIPASLGNLLNLYALSVSFNNISGIIPSELGNLRGLTSLDLGSNKLTGTIPASFSNLNNLGYLNIHTNQLTGAIPTFFQTFSSLSEFRFYSNKFDSVPNLTALTQLGTFEGDRNKLTFDAILPNLARGMTYTRQDSIFIATTYARNAGQSLTIDLGIDAAITTNSYKWFKNGILYRTITGSNKLIFNALQPSDAGVYTCQVTNPNALLLTLYSRKATIVINCAMLVAPVTQRICEGSSYTLRNGRTYSTAGTYRDTIGCDSIYVIDLVINRRDSIELPKITRCYGADTTPVITRDRNIYGCDSIRVQRFRWTNPLITNMLPVQYDCNATFALNDTNRIRNFLGCDSVWKITPHVPALSYNIQLPVQNRCNPADTGTQIQPLTTWRGCDSTITQRYRLVNLLRINILPIQYVCNLILPEADTNKIYSWRGCDSIWTIRWRVPALRKDTVLPIQYRCNPADTGTRIRPLTTWQGCDSTVTERFVGARSYNRDTVIWVCDPAQVRTTTIRETSYFGCDSIVTQRFRFARANTTILPDTIVCAIADTQTVTLKKKNSYGCDSFVVRRFRLHQDDVFITELKGCDNDTLTERIDVTYPTNSRGCKTMLVTHYVFERCQCLKIAQICNSLIPNDNDQKNDVFWIENIQRFRENELIISDKHGVVVFRTPNYNNNWAGQLASGEYLPEGIYNFVFSTREQVTQKICTKVGQLRIQYIP